MGKQQGMEDIICPGAVWADNVILVASSPSDLDTMIRNTTQAIHSYGFQWKPNSLEIMTGGGLVEDFVPLDYDTVAGNLHFKRTRLLKVLGSYLAQQDSTVVAYNER